MTTEQTNVAQDDKKDKKNKNTVHLDTPIKRGDQEIKEVTLRKPLSGELRGTSVSALVQLDFDALHKVLPRITTPNLTEYECTRLDPADTVKMGVIFSGFLMPKDMLASMESQTA